MCIAWYSVALCVYDMVWCMLCMVQYGVVYGMIWCCVWYGVVYGMVLCDLCDMVWCRAMCMV